MSFNGKVAVVTGGTKGIGLATVKLLDKSGAKVNISEEDFDRVINTNLKGIYNIIKCIVTHMENNGKGK